MSFVQKTWVGGWKAGQGGGAAALAVLCRNSGNEKQEWVASLRRKEDQLRRCGEDRTWSTTDIWFSVVFRIPWPHYHISLGFSDPKTSL